MARVESQLSLLITDQKMLFRYSEYLKSNALKTDFADFVIRTAVESLVGRIYRLTEDSSASKKTSLVKMLNQIKDLNLHSKKEIDLDLKTLEGFNERKKMYRARSVIKKITKYRHRIVSHSDERGYKNPPTYNDLEKAVKLLEEIYLKYYCRINDACLPQIDPVNMDYIFTQK